MKAGWEVRPLGEVAKLHYGKALAKSERNPEGKVPIFGANGILGWSDHILTEGPSLIVGRKGSAGEVNRADGPFWPSDVTYYTEHDAAKLNFEFFHYGMLTLDIPSLAKGVKPGINRNEAYDLPFPIPPLKEQKRIVAVLDAAFKGLTRAAEHARANLQNARELFESFVESVFSRQRNKEMLPLGDTVEVLTGFAFKSAEYSDQPNDMAMVRGDNIVQGHFRWKGVKRWPSEKCAEFKKYRLDANDVLLAMDRTWVKDGIKFAVVSKTDLPLLLVQRVARLRCLPNLKHDYLGHFIGSKQFEKYVLSIQTGIGVPHISGQQIKDCLIYCPDVAIQTEIADELTEQKLHMQALAANYRTKLTDIADLRQSLLQKAFAGELT